MIIKYDSSNVYLPGASDIVDPKLSLEDNKAGALSFTMLPTHALYNSIAKLKPLMVVYDDDGDVLWKGRAIESDVDFYGQNEVTCEGKLACLNDSLYRPSTYQGTVQGLLSAILTNHNNQVSNDQKILLGTVSSDIDLNNYIYREWEKHTTSWELVKTRLIDELGGHLIMRYESDGDYLDYKSDADMTTVSSQTVRLGENLTDLEQFIDATSTYTACIPVGAEIVNVTYSQVEYTASEPPEWKENTYYHLASGAYTLVDNQTTFNTLVAASTALYTIASTENTGTYVDITSINTSRKASGLDYLVNTTAQALYGTIYAPIDETTWDDVTEPLNLYNKAVAWLDNQGISLLNEIDISFADLSKLGYNTDDIKLYDKIVLVSDFHGFSGSVQYRVLDVTYNLDAPETSSITVNSSSQTLTDKTASQQEKIDRVDNSITIIESNVGNKEDASDAETRFKQVQKSIEETEETLSSRIEETEKTSATLSSKITSVEQRADAIEIHASQTDTTIASHGETIENVNANFKFSADGMEIGREGSTSTMLLDNDSLEFKVNGNTVAEFTQSHLDVKNVETDNEVGYFDQWATRKGAYITGKGNNLNDLWIGG